MIASRQIAFGGGKRGLSAKDYVQDGLRFHFDTIDAKGYGSNESPISTGAVEWHNLVGNEVLTHNLGTSKMYGNLFYQGAFEMSFEDSEMDNYQDEEFTIGTIFGTLPIDNSAEGVSGRILFPSSQFAAFGVAYWWRTLFVRSGGAYYRWEQTSSNQLLYPERGYGFGCNLHSWVITYSKGVAKGYVDGRLGKSLENPYDEVVSLDDEWRIDAYVYLPHDDNKWTFSGKNTYGSFMFYTRAITAEEVAHNFDVDVARFGEDIFGISDFPQS